MHERRKGAAFRRLCTQRRDAMMYREASASSRITTNEAIAVVQDSAPYNGSSQANVQNTRAKCGLECGIVYLLGAKE